LSLQLSAFTDCCEDRTQCLSACSPTLCYPSYPASVIHIMIFFPVGDK
jgi:hypothetical protein